MTATVHNSITHKPSRLIRLTVAIIGMLAFLQVYSVQAILPVLVEQFRTTEVQAGLAVGMTVMAIALMSPFMGMLSDSIGRKGLIVACLLLIAIPSGMIGVSDSIGEVHIWRFLQGIFVPGITVVTIAYISEEFPNDIAAMMSMYVSGTVLGGFLGRFVIGYLHTLMGWQYGYLVTAAVMIAGAVWVAKTLPTSKNFVTNENFGAALATLGRHAKNPYVLSACMLGACVLFSLVGIFTFVNLHLARSPYYLGSAALANIFCVYLIGMVITPLSTRLIEKLGIVYALILAIGVSMVGVLIVLAKPLWLIVVGLTVLSSGVFVTQAATISYISKNVKEGRSLASGLYYMCYYAGGSLGAWACGLAFSRYDWYGVAGTVMALQVLGLFIVYFGMKKRV